jgi:hypothetical protein
MRPLFITGFNTETAFSILEQINGDLARPTLFVADEAKAHKADCFEKTHMILSK